MSTVALQAESHSLQCFTWGENTRKNLPPKVHLPKCLHNIRAPGKRSTRFLGFRGRHCPRDLLLGIVQGTCSSQKGTHRADLPKPDGSMTMSSPESGGRVMMSLLATGVSLVWEALLLASVVSLAWEATLSVSRWSLAWEALLLASGMSMARESALSASNIHMLLETALLACSLHMPLEAALLASSLRMAFEPLAWA